MTHAVPEYTLEQLEADGRIELDHFTGEDAFELGTLAAGVTQEWGLSLCVNIVIGDDLVYRVRLGETGIGNDPWLEGKAAVARHFGDSSLLVKLRQESTGVAFTDTVGVMLAGSRHALTIAVGVLSAPWMSPTPPPS